MTGVQHEIDWPDWLRRWDAQQEGYVPDREARFAAMFDAVAELVPSPFVALDLGCGPGSLSARLLARFPGARAVAVDVDPVMLAVGRGALGTADGRLTWMDTDLATSDWRGALGATQVDMVLSATALHWLWPDALTRLYADLGRLLRPGGLFLNGDHMAFGSTSPTCARLSGSAQEAQWTDAAFAARGLETAEQWWAALAAEPGLEAVFAEQARRFAGTQRQHSPPGVDVHVEALRAAGFREVGTIWQVLANRVLLAVR